MQLNAQSNKSLKKRIDETIFQYLQIDYKKYPGFVIGIIDNDSTYFFSYGEITSELPRLPGKNDRFEIGEVTQVFSALLAESLIQTGDFSDTSKIVHLVEGLKICGFNPEITIGQLLSHTSGIAKSPDNLGMDQISENPYYNYTMNDLKSYLCEKAAKESTPGEKYDFSLVGYALLGALIQEIKHTRIDNLAENMIFKPVGMSNSCLECNNSNDSLSTGFTIGGTVAMPWNTNVFKSALGMESTAEDLVKFLDYIFHHDTTALASAFNKTIQPVIQTGLDKKSAVAKGWHVYKMKKYHDICMSVGHTGGHSAFVGFVERTHTGVVILANTKNGMSQAGVSILGILNNNWKKNEK